MKVNLLAKCTLLAFTASLMIGCVSSTSMGAGAKRKQLMLVSEQYEVKKADKAVAKMFHGGEKVIYRLEERRLAEIMNTLIPYADVYMGDRQVKWDIHVDYRNKKIQAGAMANGLIIVSGNFFKHNFTDEDFAFLIAHEMAHVIRSHHREKTTWRYMASPLLIATALTTSGSAGLVAGLVHDGYGAGYKKSIEREADLLGLEIIARAGYNPENAKSLFDRAAPIFKDQYPIASRLPAYFTSHPSMERRKKLVDRYMPKVKELYEHHEIKTSDRLINTNPGGRIIRPSFRLIKSIDTLGESQIAEAKIKDISVIN